MDTRTRTLAIVATLLFACGLLFWPTLYRYDRLGAGGDSIPLRINRLTGRTQWFVGGEWLDAQGPKDRRTSTDTSRSLTPLELGSVSGRAALDRVGYFSGDLYNGTQCTLTKIFLTIEAKDSRGATQWRRSFQNDVFIQPMTTEDIILQVGRASAVAGSAWSIDSAHATCPKPK